MTDGFAIIVMSRGERNRALMVDTLQDAGFTVSGVATLDELSRRMEACDTTACIIDSTGLDDSLWDFCHTIHGRGKLIALLTPPGTEAAARQVMVDGISALVQPITRANLLALAESLAAREAN